MCSMVLALELLLNEPTQTSSGCQIACRSAPLRNGDALMQHAIKKHERRDAHVWPRMHKHRRSSNPPSLERNSEILRGGRLKSTGIWTYAMPKSRNHAPSFHRVV